MGATLNHKRESQPSDLKERAQEPPPFTRGQHEQGVSQPTHPSQARQNMNDKIIQVKVKLKPFEFETLVQITS